ncbi:hypothetical protein T439DRAFT_344799 [Meredithblackwellia eburnea MCA 4105]
MASHSIDPIPLQPFTNLGPELKTDVEQQAIPAQLSYKLDKPQIHNTVSQKKPSTSRWKAIESALWGSIPIIFYLFTLIVVIYNMLQTSRPFWAVRQAVGTGKIEYFFLHACATVPGESVRTCGPRSIDANFTPSIVKISQYLPGYSTLALSFRSRENQGVYFASFLCFVISLMLFTPLWILYYFPEIPYPSRVTKFMRYHPKRIFQVSGAFAFISWLFLVTIGIGYKLSTMNTVLGFNIVMYDTYRAGYIGDNGTSIWEATLGTGFDMVWVAMVGSSLTMISIQVILHNYIYEKIEQYGQDTSHYHASY